MTKENDSAESQEVCKRGGGEGTCGWKCYEGSCSNQGIKRDFDDSYMGSTGKEGFRKMKA